MNKVCAVILAAGKGKRMGAKINKQFLEIRNKPILYYTLKAFSESTLIDEIVLVAGENEINYCKNEVVDKYNIKKVTSVVKGGKERQHSVINGLKAIESCEIVLIHDGARPFINDDIIQNGIKYAKEYGASACGVMPKDTIKLKSYNNISEGTLDRNSLIAVQTPQCFRYELILDAHNKVLEKGFQVTDDTMVVETFGHEVYLYEGSYSNIKITTFEDLMIADRILSHGDI